jgi:hypothetical protein
MSDNTIVEHPEVQRRRQHLRTVYNAIGEAIQILDAEDQNNALFLVSVPAEGVPTVSTHDSFEAVAAVIRSQLGTESYAYVFTGRRWLVNMTASGRVLLETPQGDIELASPPRPAGVPDGALFERASRLEADIEPLMAGVMDGTDPDTVPMHQPPGWSPPHQDDESEEDFDEDESDS